MNTSPLEADQKACICPQCPSYFDCKEILAFCLKEKGKSNCIKTESGCLCPACPVQEKYKLTHEYYCLRGSEKEIMQN
jgi:hypothetical protein